MNLNTGDFDNPHQKKTLLEISAMRQRETREHVLKALNLELQRNNDILLSKSALRGFRHEDIIELYKFLINTATKPKISHKRPPHPITGPQARVGYKIDMITYISQFGYKLDTTNPCKYSWTFLESFASYCEGKVGIKETTKRLLDDSKKTTREQT